MWKSNDWDIWVAETVKNLPLFSKVEMNELVKIYQYWQGPSADGPVWKKVQLHIFCETIHISIIMFFKWLLNFTQSKTTVQKKYILEGLASHLKKLAETHRTGKGQVAGRQPTPAGTEFPPHNQQNSTWWHPEAEGTRKAEPKSSSVEKKLFPTG